MRATEIKIIRKGCVWVGHKTFTSNILLAHLSQKGTKKTHHLLVDNILEHIPEL